jgi:hypothetical protein
LQIFLIYKYVQIAFFNLINSGEKGFRGPIGDKGLIGRKGMDGPNGEKGSIGLPGKVSEYLVFLL